MSWDVCLKCCNETPRLSFFFPLYGSCQPHFDTPSHLLPGPIGESMSMADNNKVRLGVRLETAGKRARLMMMDHAIRY